MRKLLLPLLFLALIASCSTSLHAMHFETPLSLTQPLLCPDGRYDYEDAARSKLGASFDEIDMRLFCIEGDVVSEVTTSARWLLFGYGTAVYFLLFIVIAVRMRQNATKNQNEPQSIHLPADEASRIHDLAQTRQIEAIKQVRQMTNSNLRDAKAYVDALIE